MANWYYFNKSGDKVGPIRGRELKQLVLDGTVTPDTLIENEEGRQGKAGKVNGLTFPEPPTPQSAIVSPVEPNPFTGTMPAVDNSSVAVPQSIPVRIVLGGILLLFVIGEGHIGILLLFVIGGWLMWTHINNNSGTRGN